MFIKDVQKFINRFKIISEAVTLPQIRRGIIGKEKEIPVIDSDKEWYEEHKKEVLNTIEKALNVDDKTLKNNLQKFDTDDFFTNDRPRKLKIKNLLKAVRRNFISKVERKRQTEDKTIGIDSQYEMMKMENGVEVYAVYTPMANRYLSHTKLWVQGCFSPDWCIASSTANNFWNQYHLYEADFPSVFIVAQKKNGVYNPIKYELKCNPHNSSQFKNGEIVLKEWVDECRDPEQYEKDYNETSLFDSFNIRKEDLENVIYKLVNSEKSSHFSKNYGKKMIDLYTKKIKSANEDTKLEYLTKACKNGTFINFCDKIDKEDKEYFLDELIRYGTLTEVEVKKMELMDNKDAIFNLIKNKRCTYLSLEWAKKYFDGNMVRKVFHSLPEEILLMDNFEGINVGGKIFEAIQDVDGLATEYVNYLFQKDGVNNTILEYVKDDKELLTKCINSMIENGKVDNDTLEYVEKDKEILSKCIYFMIGNDKVNNRTLYYIKNDKELLSKCIYFMIENGKVDDKTLYYVEKDKEILSKCIYSMIKKGEVNCFALKYVKNDKELLTKYINSMIQNSKVNYYTLKIVKDNKELFLKCVDYLIENGKFNNDVLRYVENDKELFLKCLYLMIKNGKVDNDTLKYYVNKDDKELLTKCLYSMIENGEVNDDTLNYVKNDKELLTKCIYSMIENGKVNIDILRYVKDDKELLTKCIYSMIENGKVDNVTLRYYVNKDDKELLTKCLYSMIENGKVDNYALLCVNKDDKELLSKCIYSMIQNDKVDDDTLECVKDDKELYLKCKNYLENK